MGHQTEHYQIGVSSIQTVRHVGLVVLAGTLLSDELHDLVFALAWAVGVREDDDETFPERMVVHTFVHVVVEGEGDV